MKTRQKTYTENQIGQIGQFLGLVAQNMPPLLASQMQGWNENPKALKRFLEGLNQPFIDGKPSSFQMWREIIVGGKTKQELSIALTASDGYYDSTMLEGCGDILRPHRARLCMVSPEMLGFTKEPPLEAILDAATRAGLTYDSSIGPYVRIAFFDQAKDQKGETGSLWIAGKPLKYGMKGSEELFSLFFLDNPSESGPYLGSDALDEDYGDYKFRNWDLDHEFVFMMGELEPIEQELCPVI